MEVLKELLESLGLENNEAVVYLEALKLGTSPASSIAKNVGISRTSVRYTCEILIKKGLMIGSQKGNTKLFTAETPQKIKNLIKIEKNKLEEKEKKLDNNLDELYNLYNPYTKIPKMTFYEGIDGAKKILNDHLKDGINVYSFIDLEGIISFFGEIQEWYTKKRKGVDIVKKNIFSSTLELDEEFNKKYGNIINNKLNHTKYIKGKKLYIASYLYEGKFSYITLKKGKFFGAIIDDEEFYNYHKSIFDFMWENASDSL